MRAIGHQRSFLSLLILIGWSGCCHAFQQPTRAGRMPKRVVAHCRPFSCPSMTPYQTTSRLGMVDNNSPEGGRREYSQEIYLREEIESPFRKIRFFFYISLAGGALTSLFISLTRIAAGLSGINVELLDESLRNAGIDLVGLVVLFLLFQQDLRAQESRLKRASKGAELASLVVRGSKSMMEDFEFPASTSVGSNTFQMPLAALRRGRGIEKRVVIAAAGKERIDQVMREAKELRDPLTASDLLIVPVVMPGGLAPEISQDDVPPCVAFPVGNSWRSVVADEAAEAAKQGVDAEKEGFCVILKKNGRVGQRTRGIFLGRMVGDVEQRAGMGMDIKNI